MAKRAARKTASQQKIEANKYDKVVKENLNRLIPVLLKKVLKVEILHLENLPQVRMQTTKEAEPDFLKKAYTAKYPDGCIFQIEFETKDESRTDRKMHFYVGMAHFKFNLPVDLTLIYLRTGRPKHITGQVNFHGLSYSYPVICLDDYSYLEFIDSNVPEEVLLCILANPNDEAPATIIRLILKRLVELKQDSNEIWKFINQLKILSMLRNLRSETEHQIRNMIIDKDIVRQIWESEDFQLGIEKGLELGMEKGMEKGLEKGMEKGLDLGKLKAHIIAIQHMTVLNYDAKLIAGILGITKRAVLEIQNQLEKSAEILEMLNQHKLEVKSIAKKLEISQTLVEVVRDDFK